MTILNKECHTCGKVFEKPVNCSKKSWEKRVTCSIVCFRVWAKGKHFSPASQFKEGSASVFRGRKRLNITGKNHGRWEGGRYKRPDGYVMVLIPGHPYGKDYGYVREHRHVMEQKIGRYLLPTEIVHHVNGIKDDNRIENLELISSKGEHSSLHLRKTHWLKRK